MNRASLAIAAITSIAGAACDLAELEEGTVVDAATGTIDAPTTPPADAPDVVDNIDAGVGPDADLTIPPGSPIGSCDPATWIATASISHPVNPPSHAIDTLAPTRWSTGAPQSAGQYVQIDLGGFVFLDRVDIEHGYAADGRTDYPRALDVLVSYDGTDFSRNLRSLTVSSDPGAAVSVELGGHPARAVRLALTGGAGESWWTIHELRFGCHLPDDAPTPDAGVPDPDAGVPGGEIDPNHAAWTATASSTSQGDAVAAAFDGNPATRWATGKTPQYGDEWFRLDLGAALDVRHVRLTSVPGDFPSAYVLETSLDDLTFEPVASGLGADVTDIGFAPRSARYLRVRQIGSGHDHWWGINELTVIR